MGVIRQHHPRYHLISSITFQVLHDKMATRAFSNLSNIPKPTVDAKRVTRATRKVLGDISSSNAVNKKPIVTEEKENTALPKNGTKLRQTKVAARRLASRSGKELPMEVEDVSVVPVIPIPEERVLPPGVKDIDEDDGDNPQLVSEYAMETYVYLKQLEKMRAVLIDWLVEVQIQFKLLQETLFLTVDTIDRFMALEGHSIPRAKLQLVGVSAMFLISKIE